VSGDGATGQPDPFDYSDEWRGDASALELTPEQEDYRSRAFDAALHYARDFGLSLVPIWWMADKASCACRQGESCANPGKHPVDKGWPEMATSDPEQAARWWRKLEPSETLPVDWYPRANIGAVMGERHFITDVDVDAGKQGNASLERLIAESGGEAMPETLTYQTGGGGRQAVTLVPEGTEVRSSASKLAPGIDIKGVRSFGILPPSVSGKGGYRMLSDISPDVQPPAWLADWLSEQHRGRTEHIKSYPAGDLRQLPRDGLTRRAHGYLTAALGSAAKAIATAKPQTRNTTLNSEAFALFAKFGRAGFLSADDIVAALSAAAQACGLDDKAIFDTLDSARKGGQIKDRTAELADFLFEEPGEENESGVRKPSITSCLYAFEAMYDLRRAVTGEFISRPNIEEMPALVCDINDELGHRLRLWWRIQAEAWEEKIREKTAQLSEGDQAAVKEAEEEHATITPPDATFSTVLSHLRASATQHPPVVRHIRCFDDPEMNRVVVDLCDDLGRVVLVTENGWEVTDVRSVPGQLWFQRNGDMKQQVAPVWPESVLATLEKARKIFGVTQEQWKLILGALAGWHFSSIPRPGGWLSGVSGTGKTTRGAMWAGLIDPVEYLDDENDTGPDKRDARVQAVNHFLVTQDNVTAVNQKASDSWCRLHTGVSTSVRKLHSDNVMLTFKYMRVALGTSVSLPAGFRADALRRMLHIRLAVTADHPLSTSSGTTMTRPSRRSWAPSTPWSAGSWRTWTRCRRCLAARR
jgi:hypothetical protein